MKTTWREWPIGSRVTVRRRLADGFYDVVGELISRDDAGIVVRRRSGEEVEIPAEVIFAARLVT